VRRGAIPAAFFSADEADLRALKCASFWSNFCAFAHVKPSFHEIKAELQLAGSKEKPA
jgi:hypothetical protein